MVEFNSDGSIKLPLAMQRDKIETENKMQNTKCMLLKREVVNFSAPKKCILHLTLSSKMEDNRFVEGIHTQFSENASVPTKLFRQNEKEFEIEIGTHFKRCSDCNNLIKRYKEHLYNNFIENKGNCTFEDKRNQNFCYEDYFD